MPARKASTSKSPAIYVLAGQEEFLIREKLDELLREHVSETARGFDYNEFRTGDTDAKTLWNALITLPLLAERRVVVLHVQGEPKDDVQKALAQYAAHPAATTVLIVVQATDATLNLKSSSQVEVISCAAMKESQRMQWARDYAKRFGKDLTSEAVDYLISTSSPRLADIASKLDHAMLYVGEDKEITGGVVMKVAGVSSEYLPWNLEDAILKRHPQKIFEITRSLREGGEELLRLLAYQRGSLLQLWQVSSVIKRAGKSKLDKNGQELVKQRISDILGRKSWKYQDFQATAAALGEFKLRQAIKDLLDLEVQLKKGRAGWNQYYKWLWKICGASSRRGTSLNH